MRILIRALLLSIVLCCVTLQSGTSGNQQSSQSRETRSNPPIYIAFLWHMHQPIYWPYESVVQTDQNARYSYSVADIHNQRWGPYTTWPKDAVQSGISAGLAHLGAQVSFSGSLIENLNNLEAAGNGNFQGWKSSWSYIRSQLTSLGHPRIDMVGFGYHHPLMGLIDYPDIRKQIQAHKQMFSANFGGSYSKGIFPPENAFSDREIPALADEGLQWVLVDNIHFDRACTGYPYSTSGNLVEPNKADQRNPNPGDWINLTGLWAPTGNSARWGRQPHYVRSVDPSTGTVKKIIAVPCDRYMGNEDGRGGFGALNYDAVISQLEPYNTDAAHPILIVLHHDGDNYGGGTDSYYHSNFQNFVNWLLANPSRFVCTTVEDYLQMFPPDTGNVIHIEDGSWSGADNGDPEFKKWNGDPVGGYSPDRNSWGVITAAKNYVLTAEQINPSASGTQNAWHYFLNGEASDYWYWDGSQNGLWDSHPSRASNLAIPYAQSVIQTGTDLTPPTIYLPQREPYNPGGTEWGINQASTFTVWTYAYDVSGLKSVTLRYRTSTNATVATENELYSGGTGTGAWTDLSMSGTAITPQTNPLPMAKAKEYSASIGGLNNILVDYYVEAVDSSNNTGRSPIMHVWVGPNSGGGPVGNGVSWTPVNPAMDSLITITVSGAAQGASLHWGVNNSGSSWVQPNAVYWPAGTTLFSGTGPAVETPMSGPDTGGHLTLSIGPFNNAAQSVQRVAFVLHYNNNTWDNNSGSDYHITVSGTPPPAGYTMDGNVDSTAALAASGGGLNLYIGWNGSELYVAAPSAQTTGGDMFILLADSIKPLRTAMWGKSGSVPQWKVFLGNESTNNWAGWFNQSEVQTTSGVLNAAGAYLEGSVNLQTVFGRIPPTIYIAAAKYVTADAGALAAQVPAGNGNGNIDTTEFYTYSYSTVTVPPPAPSLLSPASGSVNQPVALTLRWNGAATAASYHIQCSADSLFSGSMILDDSAVTATSRLASGFANLTSYYWRVAAKNAGGSSSYSAVWKFTTIVAAPATPVLSDPPDNSVLPSDSVSVRWTPSPRAVTYHVQIAADSLFAVRLVDDSITTDTVRFFTHTPGRFYWRVAAANAGGRSNWSTRWSFTIPAPVPEIPILASPADGDSLSGRVIMSWHLPGNATSCNIQVSGDTLFSSLIVNDTLPADTVRAVDGLSGECYWRVRSMNAWLTSGWSPVRRFTVSGVYRFLFEASARWNLLSLPYRFADPRVSVIFPTASSKAFSYSGGVYQQVGDDTLRRPAGYWIKFPSQVSVSVPGTPVLLDTIPLVSGWNLVGTIAVPVPAGRITVEPPGNVSSKIFQYDTRYTISDTLMPGRGYWIKARETGFLILAAPAPPAIKTLIALPRKE